MRYYRLMSAGERDARSIGYVLSTERTELKPWPKGRWSPTYDMIYMTDNPSGLFDESTRRELPKLTAILRPKVKELPDIIGEFSFNIAATPPLVSHRLKALMEELAPGCCEYLPAPKIWDATFAREVDRSDYQFANFIKQMDGWDHNLTEITKFTRGNGSVGYSMGGVGTVNSAAMVGHHLWRDSYTKHVLCSDEFKVRAELAGISNFHFEQMKTNR